MAGESLDALLEKATEAAPVETPEPQAAPETGDKAPSAAPPADAEPTASQDPPHVPRKALEDERRKRQELERRLAEFEKTTQPQQHRQPPQQQQAAPQITREQLEQLWWENPSQAAAIIHHFAAQEAAIAAEKRMLSRELDRSERRARKAHGDELIDEALQEAMRIGKSELLNEDDPYQALVDWYQDVKAVKDPKSLKEQLRAELMAELGMSNAPAQPPKAAVPKSLASRTSAQPRNPANGQFQGRASLEDILG